MAPLKPLLVFPLLCMSTLCASAEYTPKAQRAISAIASSFPHLDTILEMAEGDLNEDGISDLALVVTGQKQENSYRDERLVVLTGNPDGSYAVLSVSNEFCHVRWHYNIGIDRRSLFVTGFNQVNAGTSKFTLQFRYNAKLKDLELIGSEELDADDETRSYYKVSVNYSTKTVIHSRKEMNKLKDVIAQTRNDLNLATLQGFNCDSYSDGLPSIRINQDFSIKRR